VAVGQAPRYTKLPKYSIIILDISGKENQNFMPIKSAQLVIHDPHHSKKAGEILIQPSPDPEGADLFMVVEIDSAEPHDYKLIEQLLTTAHAAYQNSQIANTEKALEMILQQLNQDLETMLPRQKHWLNKIHCAVALAAANQLFFSTIGKIKVFLIKPTVIKEIADRESGEFKFSHTLSGTLKAEDKILISTDNLINYISLEKIKKTVATLPPKSAIAHLGNILQATSPEISFFSIILQAGAVAEADPTGALPGRLTSPGTSKSSLDQLLAVKRETEKILTPPSFVQSIKERIRQKNRFNKNINEKRSDDHPVVSRKKTGLSLKRLANLQLPTAGLLKSLRPVLPALLKPKRQLNLLLIKMVKTFSRLSKTNKILMLAVVILLLLFSQNLIWQSQRQSGTKSETSYQNLLGEIENKQNGIEASLIYNDTVRAKQLLQEIYALLEDFPQNTKEKIAAYQQTSESVQILYERIWRVTNILEPLVIINFAEINPSANAHQIAVRNNRLYGFNDSRQLFTYDLTTNEKIIIENYDIGLINEALFPKTNQIIGFNPGKSFYSLVENETAEIEVSLPAALQDIDDLTFFLDKMYLLDKTANQIFRLTQSGKNFISGQSWIKDGSPVNQGVSMAVDGYLFLLSQNGQIQKFASGNKRDFPAKINVEPELTAPTKIYTDAEDDYLYVLDPPNKRFLIITKAGEIKNQYFSEKFNDLKDFVVEEQNKKIYLLNGNQVFVVAIQ